MAASSSGTEVKTPRRMRSWVIKPKSKRSVSNACRCTPIGAMIGGWRSKQNKCPLAA